MLFLSELGRLLAAGLLTLATVATGNTVLVQEGRVVDDDLYAAGGTVFIEGELEGDLVVLGSRVIITGVVHGDVTSIGGSTSVFGEVDGSVRTVSLSYSQSGSVGDDVLAIGRRAVIDGSVGGDALFYTWSATTRGAIGGSVLGEVVDRLMINGPVESVDAGAYRMQLGTQAVVTGAVAHNPGLVATYLPPLDSSVKISDSAQVPTVLDIPVASAPLVVRSGRWAVSTLFFLSTLFTAAGLVGLGRNWVDRSLQRAFSPLSFLIGLAVLILLPAIALLISLSVVLLPLGFVLFAAWVIFVLGGAAPVLIRVGTAMVKRPDALILGLVVGAVVWRLIRFVPFVGPIVWLVAAALGTGALVLALPRRLSAD